jgi:AAA15 family ATPase/GTPase
MKWFKSVNFVDGTSHSAHGVGTNSVLKQDEFNRTRIAEMLKTADFGVSGIQFPSHSSMGTSIKLLHKKFDEALHCISHESFLLDEQESKGIQSFLALSASIIDALNHGKFLMVDGMGVHLHPQLTIVLVSMFNEPDLNTKGAQLIFSSHDTHLLHQSILQKSQIWFAEKDMYGATRLYSLDQFEDISYSDDIERQYLLGQFGAIPCLERFKRLN